MAEGQYKELMEQDQSTEQSETKSRRLNWSRPLKRSCSISFEPQILVALKKKAEKKGMSLSLYLNGIFRSQLPKDQYTPAALKPREVKVLVDVLSKIVQWGNRPA